MRFSFKFWQQYTSWLLMALLSSCVDPFEPEVIDSPDSLLVVNGFINSNGPTTITLSRTQSLTEVTPPQPEENARIFLEEEGGARTPLAVSGQGEYTVNSSNLNGSKRYRIHITTANNKVYASEYVNITNTPPIEAITWKAENNKLQIFVNTRQAADQTRYYRWQYEETWEFTSAYGTYLEYKDGKISVRTDDINKCWRTENSTEIILGNTLRLSQNIISEQPIISMSARSPKISRKYSILVKQFAQTPEEYQYWEMLKKNTENIGTLFDPLPSQLNGNIKSVSNTSEAVIGYVGAYSLEEKRIFISIEELPTTWLPSNGYESCPPIDTVKNNSEEIDAALGAGSGIPLSEILPEGGLVPIAYTYSTKDCVDCRVRGTNIRPSFWQ